MSTYITVPSWKIQQYCEEKIRWIKDERRFKVSIRIDIERDRRKENAAYNKFLRMFFAKIDKLNPEASDKEILAFIKDPYKTLGDDCGIGTILIADRIREEYRDAAYYKQKTLELCNELLEACKLVSEIHIATADYVKII